MKQKFELFVKQLKKTTKFSSFTNLNYLNFDSFYEKDLIQIKKTIGKHRGCVLILTDEPHFYYPGSLISKQWLEFKEILLKYEIFNCDFIACSWFVDSNTDSFNYLNKNFYDWKFHNVTLDAFPIRSKVSELKIAKNHDLDVKNCTMKLSHLNFTHRMHRQLFSKFLIKENIVDKNLIVINGHRRNRIESKLKKNGKIMINPLQNDGWFYNKKLLDLWKDITLKKITNKNIDRNYDSPYMNVLKKAAFNIVSETVFDFPYPNFGEKTIQPILSKRPFIMIGPYGNLKTLRNKGFKTFHSVIDESYDDIEDPNKRLEAVMNLVLELNNMSQSDLNTMLYNLKDVLLHNFYLITKKG